MTTRTLTTRTLTTTALPQKHHHPRQKQTTTTTMLLVGRRATPVRSSSFTSSVSKPFAFFGLRDDRMRHSLRRRTTTRRVDAATVVGGAASDPAKKREDDDDDFYYEFGDVTAGAHAARENASSSSSSSSSSFAKATLRRRRKLVPAAAVLLLTLTASALLFPETSLAKAKTAAVENSAAAGFSFKVILDWILHLDKHLVELFATSGKMAYGVLFAIIFAETGFVVTPFLPGDSLLFACGALGALGVLNFPLVFGLLFVAAVLGDTVNYTCGAFLGQVAIEKNPKIFKPEYIAKTRTFYDKYGGRTVVLARFFVIVRTFAPFIAGVAKMNYSKFALYNVLGAGVWITSFMGLGYFFGNVPVVKENFATAILVIIVLSLLPVILEVVNHKKDSTASAPDSWSEPKDPAEEAQEWIDEWKAKQ